jgi:hypothetical protein
VIQESLIILLTDLCEAVDRLAHHRSEIRSAALTHISIYQLGFGPLCEQRVAALLKGNLFVYDGHWALGQNAVSTSRHSRIIHCLTAFFSRRAGSLNAAPLTSTQRSSIPSRLRGSFRSGLSGISIKLYMSHPSLDIPTRKSLRYPWLPLLQPA